MNEEKCKYLKHAQNDKYSVCIWGAGFLGTQKGLQMLDKRGITVDFYCDNNSALWGKEVVDGIYCISPAELEKRNTNIVCFIMMTNAYAGEVLIQIRNLGITEIVTFDELFIEEKNTYFPFMKRNQIAFYTCIVGDYDTLMEPLSILPNCDYYVISDKKPEKKTVFRYLDIREYIPDHITDNAKKNRYIKVNAHKIFPQYRYSIYFDGQMQLESSIIKYVQELPVTRIMTFCKNYWDDPFMEAMRVILNKRDSEDIVVKQMEKYWLEGLPDNFGNVYCGILIREHNNPICKNLMNDWWEQIDVFSKRDQISFSYVLWKNGYTMNDVKTVTENFAYEGEYWKLGRQHNQPRLMHEGRIIY